LFDGTTFVQPAEGQYSQTQLKSYSASQRYVIEIQGTTSGGQPLRTDRISRAALDQTANYVIANAQVNSVNWKTLTGFETWTKASIQQYAKDVNAYVQGCYDTEMSVSDQITNGTITTLAQIDAVYEPMRKGKD
jgi:hypothetical protein